MLRLVRLAPLLLPWLLFLMGSGPKEVDRLGMASADTPTATATEAPLSQLAYFPVVLYDYGVTPLPTITPTRTLSPFPFTLQDGNPYYFQNFANTAGCNWLGIAGQVFDVSGGPMLGLIVHLEGGGLNYDVFTGDPRFTGAYGPGAYELVLGNRPIDTTDVYHIQLRTAVSQPLSDVYVIPTFADCNKNLILANFVQNH